MCGRKTLVKEIKEIIDELYIDEWQAENYQPSFNIAPGQSSPILIQEGKLRIVKEMRWGLIPSWSKNKTSSSNMINARYETINTKPSFNNLIKTNRCIVLADGYYEWRPWQENKIPYYIHHQSNKILKMAGLWTTWESGTEVVQSYTIITTTSQNEISYIHNRMPLIIPDEQIDNWLKLNEYGEKGFMKKFKPSYNKLTHYPVSKFVNYTNNNSEKCLLPIKLEKDLNLFT